MTDGEGIFPLSALPVDGRGTVAGFLETEITPRLRELGFSRGVAVECVGRNPGGGMSAYKLRGSVIALRREDASSVILEVLPSSTEENGDGK